MRHILALALAALTLTGTAAAQTTPERDRARPHNRQGWELMSAESFERAAQSFQQAVAIDNTFEDAFYGLGRAQIALKQYVSAIATLTTCRKLYIAQAGRHFTNQQDAQRYRQDRITEIDEQVRQVQTMPPSPQQQNLLRQLNNQRRDIQNAIARGNDMSIDASVPPWVSLSLGSAYFRSGKLADAEREYKAAIAVDGRFGEAHSNLAVVYFETNRIAEAEASLKAAKKAGFRVNPQLEQAIRDRRP
ncbi:MAG: tetratricopeptide repeat protein [Acidobacteriota bacterium]|nr:tetratricopeptide repeat protein [Acidobacteriota bacterium]